MTSPSGRFSIPTLGSGDYQVRAAAIGFQAVTATVSVTPSGIANVPPFQLSAAPQILPDLLAQATRPGCADHSIQDGPFSRIIEGTATAMGVIEATIRSGRVKFTTRSIDRRAWVWPTRSESADTVVGDLLSWPVRSLDPDSLRVIGFGRQAEGSERRSRIYYGPDERVLFAPWFMDAHCFVVTRDTADENSFHVRFAPRAPSARIELSGEIVLDARTLVPRRLVYQHENLPSPLPRGSVGGEVDFMQIGGRLWVPSTWRMYAPIPSIDARGGPMIAGRAERLGRVVRIQAASPPQDTTQEDK